MKWKSNWKINTWRMMKKYLLEHLQNKRIIRRVFFQKKKQRKFSFSIINALKLRKNLKSKLQSSNTQLKSKSHQNLIRRTYIYKLIKLEFPTKMRVSHITKSFSISSKKELLVLTNFSLKNVIKIRNYISLYFFKL